MVEKRKRGRPKKYPVIEKKIPVIESSYEKPVLVSAPENHTNQVDFTVTITSIPDRLVCPKCYKLQFSNLQGEMNGQLKRKCDRCGSYILYVFKILPFGISTNSPIV